MKPSSVFLGVVWGPLCLACAPDVIPGQEMRGTLDQYDLDTPVASFEMPGRLDEISGLAITADGRLFGHDDERGTVHEIDRATGEVGKRFSIGNPPIEADFEGLAIAGERFFLVTSGGSLYEFREVGDRETSPHRMTDLGLGSTCEVEGLDLDATADALVVACKVVSPDRGSIVVHRVPLDPAARRLAPIEIAREQLPAFDLDTDFQASSVVVSPEGTIVLVSTAPEAIIEVDSTGKVIAGFDLPGRRHPQPEGLAFGPDATLYMADEQNGASARVTAYARLSEPGAAR